MKIFPSIGFVVACLFTITTSNSYAQAGPMSSPTYTLAPSAYPTTSPSTYPTYIPTVIATAEPSPVATEDTNCNPPYDESDSSSRGTGDRNSSLYSVEYLDAGFTRVTYTHEEFLDHNQGNGTPKADNTRFFRHWSYRVETYSCKFRSYKPVSFIDHTDEDSTVRLDYTNGSFKSDTANSIREQNQNFTINANGSVTSTYTDYFYRYEAGEAKTNNTNGFDRREYKFESSTDTPRFGYNRMESTRNGRCTGSLTETVNGVTQPAQAVNCQL